MIRFAGCFGIMMDFFKQPRALVQIEAGNLFELFGFFWLFRQILFTSVPLYYFDLKSDWLPYFPFAFGSPPEDSVFFPVPLCDYKITRESELFKTECFPNAGIRFCAGHRFCLRRTIWALTWNLSCDMITVLGRIFPAPFYFPKNA